MMIDLRFPPLGHCRVMVPLNALVDGVHDVSEQPTVDHLGDGVPHTLRLRDEDDEGGWHGMTRDG